MINLCILVATFFLAKKLSSFSTTKNIRYSIYALTVWVFIFIHLLIYNHQFSADLATSIATYLNSVGVGNPRSWVVKTSGYNKGIIPVYYLSLLSGYIVFLASVSSEPRNFGREKITDPIVKYWWVIVMAFVIYWLFYAEWVRFDRAGLPKSTLWIRQVFFDTPLIIVWEWFMLIFFIYMGNLIRMIFTLEKKI
ncbi:MAG: hypothetical protein ACKE8R_00645 [Methylophagaceae bacterium]